MDVNFELYKVFYHVAKQLSFSVASEELYVSQSAVSQAIRTLEQRLQCKLFIRNTKQVKLTQEGENLFKHIEQAFNLIKAGERSIMDIHSLKQGEVRIGATDTICKYFLLPYLKQFNRNYPQVKIKVTNRTSPICMDLLQKGSVDLAVVNLPEKGTAPNLRIEHTHQLRDIFVAGKQYQFLQNRTLSLSDLADYPLLMLERNTTTRDFIDSYLFNQGLTLNPEIELGSVDLLVELAKIGLGIALVVEDFFTEQLHSQEVFKLKFNESLPLRSLGILTNAQLPTSTAAQKFIDLFAQKS